MRKSILAAAALLLTVPLAAQPGPAIRWDQGDLLEQLRPLLTSAPLTSEAPPIEGEAKSGLAAAAQTPIPLHCEPIVIEAFKKAWMMSGNGRRDYEAGFRVDLRDGQYEIVFAEMSYEELTLTIPIIPGVTVAIAHTHPDSAKPQAGPKDGESPLPNYIISRRSLYLTVPATGKASRIRGSDWKKPCSG